MARWLDDVRGLAAIYVLCGVLFSLAITVPIALGTPYARTDANATATATATATSVARSAVRVWTEGGAPDGSNLAAARLVPVAPATLLAPRQLAGATMGSGERARVFDATPFFAPTPGWSALSVRAANGTTLRLHDCVPRALREAVAAAAAASAEPLLVLVPSAPCGAGTVPSFATLSSWLPDVRAGGARAIVIELPASAPPPADAPLQLAVATYGLATATAMDAASEVGAAPLLAALPSADYLALAAGALTDATLRAAVALAGDDEGAGAGAGQSALVRASREYTAYACVGGETLVVACAATLPLLACVLVELARVVRTAHTAPVRAPRTTLVPLYAAYAGLALFAAAMAAQQLGAALGGDVYNLTYANDVLGELAWLGLYGAYASVALLFVRMLALARNPTAGGGFGSSSAKLFSLYLAWLAGLVVAAIVVVVVAAEAPSNSIATATALHVVALVPTAAVTVGVGAAFIVRARRASGATTLRAALRRLTALLVGAALCFAALAALYVAQSVVRARDALSFGSTLPCALRLAIRLVALLGAAVLLIFLHAWRRSLYARGTGAAGATTEGDGDASVGRSTRAGRRLARHASARRAQASNAPALMAPSTTSAFTEGERGSTSEMGALPD